MDFLIELSLILFLNFISKGHTWTVNVPRQFNVSSGLDLNIQCTFSYPEQNSTDKVEIFWKRQSKVRMDIDSKDRNQFIFHQNHSYIVEKYRGRTKLIGKPDEGDCSLNIRNITENEPNIYLRIHTGKDYYSFFENSVSISVFGAAPVTSPPDIPLFTASPNPTKQSTNNTVIYIAVFMSLAAVLIIIVATGIICFKKQRSLTRQESSYYVNFKASSVPAKREPSLKKPDNKELPEQKVIDDPVYVNLEVRSGQMDQSVAPAENIYANMDYTE